MPDDYVGLNIGGDDPGDDAAPSCPDCGGPMEPAEFKVDAPNEEVAQRVFLAYHATKNLPVQMLAAVIAQKAHLHIVQGSGADCAPDDKG